jgi:hypothetical protein
MIYITFYRTDIEPPISEGANLAAFAPALAAVLDDDDGHEAPSGEGGPQPAPVAHGGGIGGWGALSGAAGGGAWASDSLMDDVD